ncbi:IucA/IucC family protein [Streptomyces sp. NRRL F-5630]|uniref:IucA/IucC family protein n=1 Tax=Streptomyces sp. NRRL F-5630 TaxID=1463864 RepID=UPI003EBF7684
MNPNTAPDGRYPLAPEAGSTSSACAEDGVVPRQHTAAPAEHLDGAAADLLEHPDVPTAAEAAALESLLRCWVRETGVDAAEHGPLRISLPAQEATLVVPVRYWSAAGLHRFGLPRLEHHGPAPVPTDGAFARRAVVRQGRAPRLTAPLDAATVAEVLSKEVRAGTVTDGAGPGATATDGTGHGMTGTDGAGRNTTVTEGAGQDGTRGAQAAPAPPATPGEPASTVPGQAPPAPDDDLVARVRDSVRRTAVFLSFRRRHAEDSPTPFLAAEQALLLGHPLHPTPKSRQGLSEAESRLYSPELRGAFPLHWLAVHKDVLATDSAWTERGRTVSAGQLTERLAGPGLTLPPSTVALPLHPWQARDLAQRPEAQALVEGGLLTPLGPHGEAWSPTSSVRTVYRAETPAMLKLSLGLRITNSRRENLRKELHRGVEVHRLLRTGLGAEWHAAHPGFDIVRDPAWIAVDGPDGEPLRGVDVMIRHNPFTPATDAACLAGLVSPRPLPPIGGRPAEPSGLLAHGSQAQQPMRSRLSELVTRLAQRTGRPRGTVATEWFLRYLERVVRPILWLDGHAGVALEAHQQNTVVLLDADGWPSGGRYRDNQGYYFREAHREALERRLPGIGTQSDTFVPDDVTDERFTYYLAINNILGLVGALGSQGLADEHLLLAALRGFLTEAARGPEALGSRLPALLLDSPVLRCKANLLTRLHGLDELVGPVDTQSVYVRFRNPLHSS